MKILLTLILVFVSPSYIYAQDGVDEELSDAEWESVGGYPAVKGQAIETPLRVEELIEPSVEYHFSPFGRSSPFAAPMVIDIGSTAKRKETPLTAESLDNYKFVGIWRTRGGKPKALVMNSQGVGVVAVEGSPIGDKEGKILKIYETNIIVREYENLPDGTREYEDFTFKLNGNSSNQNKAEEKSGENLETSKKLSH